jgi:hypothetical protein
MHSISGRSLHVYDMSMNHILIIYPNLQQNGGVVKKKKHRLHRCAQKKWWKIKIIGKCFFEKKFWVSFFRKGFGRSLFISLYLRLDYFSESSPFYIHNFQFIA